MTQDQNVPWWERTGLTGESPPPPAPPPRRRLLTVAAAVVGAMLLAGTVSAVEGTRRPPTSAQRAVPAGIDALAAGCSEMFEWKIDEDEVGPIINGVGDRAPSRVAYSTVPASYGQYLGNAAPPAPVAYRRGEPFPVLERLVNNLRRGYVIVFYDAEATEGDVSAAAEWASGQKKALVVPWESSRPPFPEGANIGIAAWGVTQTCSRADADALSAFREAYPPDRAPSPRLP